MTPGKIASISLAVFFFAQFLLFGILYNRFDKDWMVDLCVLGFAGFIGVGCGIFLGSLVIFIMG